MTSLIISLLQVKCTNQSGGGETDIGLVLAEGEQGQLQSYLPSSHTWFKSYLY